MSVGVSVVVPYGGKERLPLLKGTLASLHRSIGDIQIIVAEIGRDPLALDPARNANADYVFERRDGAFLLARARNLGSALARHECIVWCDADLVFEPDYLTRAGQDFLASGYDYSHHYDRISFLDAADTEAVLNEGRNPATCKPIFWSTSPNANNLYFVRRDFILRNGGLIEGFRGWGFEDNAFKHKVDLLGRRTTAVGSGLDIWHLYHPASGSMDFKRSLRTSPHIVENYALFQRIAAITDGQTLQRLYPPSAHAPLPWPASARIVLALASGNAALAARARDFATCIERLFGIQTTIGDGAAPTADLVVGFSDTADECAALLDARKGRPLVLLPGDAAPRPLAWHPACWLVAANAERAARWRAAGAPVWHRLERSDGVPTAVQPMSHLLGKKYTWRLRVAVPRNALEPAAFDRSPFWYVGFHDADGQEIARADADRAEIRRLAASPDTIVLERHFVAARPPVRWTIQPVSRHKIWLAPHGGAVENSCLL